MPTTTPSTTPAAAPTRTGILLAAFGAGNEQAARALETFSARVRAVFPGVPVRWAYTSGVLRSRLAGEGKKTDSAHKALKKMWFEKYTHVVVQSLHVVPGKEFDALRRTGLELEGGKERFSRVRVGEPLLATEADVDAAARAVFAHLPAERRPDEAVLLFGHGTSHTADSRYDLLQARLDAVDPLVQVGTMDGARTLDTILAHLDGVRRVFLVPLLAVAGGHVRRDMAGRGPDSWTSRLQARGMECVPVLRGAAEYDAFAAIWIGHLRTAVAELAE
ncbi:MAG: sirohydrochlorin cobaltochelatase [Desulfovibrionaceae bacterium]|jgi:sirohydrochlorin cobaltochelatase|nr:sirohydrochlorin cobaltochelatase [Desulfovibrionaceae bacterium]